MTLLSWTINLLTSYLTLSMAQLYNRTLIERANYVISIGESAIENKDHNSSYANDSKFKSFRASGLTFLLDLFGNSHPYYNGFKGALIYSYTSYVESAIEIINTVKTEIENGWLASVRSLVSAEIFSDFLEMAEHLLSEDYKDPAAVMIGSVLEEQLRQLALANGIAISIFKGERETPKKADLINSDLASAAIYNKLDQKSVTAWLDLRNKAAHGKYSEYTKEQVTLMYQGVVNFISRTT